MMKTFRPRRATALAATAAVVAGAAVTVLPPSAAFSAAQTRPVQAVSTAPRLTKLTPALGDVAGGTVVEILGANLKNTTEVTFGGRPAARFVPLSDTRLIAVAPPGALGSATLTVTTGGGAAGSRFGYRLPLTADFTGVTASAAGTTRFRVPVSGASLGATASAYNTLRLTAKVGGATARVTRVDETTVEVTAPATTRAAAASLQLFQDGFGGPVPPATVDYVPAVTGVTPAKVSTEGGTIVKISGAGFLTVDEDDPNAVTFGGVPAASVHVASATQIIAEVPAGAAGNATVRVAAPTGASTETKPQVTYRAPLGIDTTGLVLKGGPVLLTVTGGTVGADVREFASRAISVTMGRSRLSATWVDPTHVKVTMPATTAESATLTLVHDTVPGPPATVAVAPSVTGLSLATDTIAGGRTVVVRVAGPGAATATGFTFGGTPATCRPQGTAFSCVVPPASEAGPVSVAFTTADGTPSRFTAPASFSYTDID